MTHICVSDLTIIVSDNGLSPGRRQAIIWTNTGILLNEPLGTNLSEILIEIRTFSFKKMRLKVSSAKWRPFCLGLNVLTQWSLNTMGKTFHRWHFKMNFLKGNFSISIPISWKFVPKGSVNNKSKMVVVMAWHWRGAKPLPEPMLIYCPMDTRGKSQWNILFKIQIFH